ncbi:unnamed protein product [Cunninghamella echinulata]
MKSWNVCQTISSVEDHFDIDQGYQPFSNELKSFGYIHGLDIECHKFKADQKIKKTKSSAKHLLSEVIPNKAMMVLTKMVYTSPTEPIILEGYTSKKNYHPLKKKLKSSTQVEFSLSSYFYDIKNQEWFTQWSTHDDKKMIGKVKRIEAFNMKEEEGRFGIRLALNPIDQLQTFNYKTDATSDSHSLPWGKQYDDTATNPCASIKTKVLKKPEALMQLITNDVLF